MSDYRQNDPNGDTFGRMLSDPDPLDAILATARLTTESSQSSYGYPVLQIGGDVYGPADIVPGVDMTAAAIVAKQCVLRCRSISAEQLSLSLRFCALCPEGPQPYLDTEAGEVRVR